MPRPAFALLLVCAAVVGAQAAPAAPGESLDNLDTGIGSLGIGHRERRSIWDHILMDNYEKRHGGKR